MEDDQSDRIIHPDGAEHELQDFSAEFRRMVSDWPGQRAIDDIDRLLKVVDELAERTVHLTNIPLDRHETD